MSASTAIALALALVSTTLTNLAYVLEHDAAAAMPVLSMRRPVQSALILLRNRSCGSVSRAASLSCSSCSGEE